MAFCKLSADLLLDNYTFVENVFINDFLPNANGDQVKAYLYGLYLCNNVQGDDNSLESFCSALNLKNDEVYNIFNYWQECGLIKIISIQPFEIKYLPFKNRPPKKYKAGKFSDFNIQLQELYPNRMLTPNEYNEYYEAIEQTKISPEAMIMIARYCIDFKGQTVRYPYILTVAKDWATENIKSVKDVEQKLGEFASLDESIKKVATALKKKSRVGLDEMQMFTKWQKSWGFTIDAIVFTAKKIKSGGFNRLNNKLDELYRMNIFSVEQIKNYTAHRDKLYQVAKIINKRLGLFYDDLDNIIETYTAPWLAKGFDEETLVAIAHYCFLGNIRTIQGMDKKINKFYKKGRITLESVQQYIDQLLKIDQKIQKIIETTGSIRTVTNPDRTFYKTWTNDWHLNDELINYAASLATGKTNPMPYLNKILSNWQTLGIKNIEEAQKQAQKIQTSNSNNKQNTTAPSTQRQYTQGELSKLFQNLENFDDLDI